MHFLPHLLSSFLLVSYLPSNTFLPRRSPPPGVACLHPPTVIPDFRLGLVLGAMVEATQGPGRGMDRAMGEGGEEERGTRREEGKGSMSGGGRRTKRGVESPSLRRGEKRGTRIEERGNKIEGRRSKREEGRERTMEGKRFRRKELT